MILLKRELGNTFQKAASIADAEFCLIPIADYNNLQTELAKNEHDQQILYECMEELNEELNYQKALNVGLLRIMVERANAKRGIIPKKNHDGYIVVYSSQVLFKGNIAWKTIIQTPFDVGLTIDEVSSDILTSLRETICPDIGCRLDEVENPEDSTPVVIHYQFAADYKSELWRVVIYTTSAVFVPANRRIRFYLNAQTK